MSQGIKYTLQDQLISKYLTHPNYYVLIKLGNIYESRDINSEF